MALTTTSTTTTTIAPPITRAPVQAYDRPRQRPRPLRRRRPQQDYYEDEYEEDDYADTRPPAKRRQPQVRGRTRRPEYDDYGAGQGRRYSDDRRPSRNRDPVYEDEADEEIEEPVRPRNRNNGGRGKVDGDRRRNQSDDRETSQRPVQKNRRKLKPKPQRYDDEEDYASTDYEDDAPKVIPSAAGGSSLFNRPRAPPRISRPVPINAQKKFEYMAKPVSTVATDEAEYDEEYDQEPVAAPVVKTTERPALNRRPTKKIKEAPLKTRAPLYDDDADDEEEAAPIAPQRNNFRPASFRNTQSRPVNNPPPRTETRAKPVDIYAEDDVEDEPITPPPRNNLRPSRIRQSAAAQQQEEGRASHRRPVVENYPADDEEEVIIAPTAPQTQLRPKMRQRNGAGRPVDKTNQDDGRPNRATNSNTSARDGGSTKFRQPFRYAATTTTSTTTSTTTTTTTTTPEPPSAGDEAYYEDDEYVVEPESEQHQLPTTTTTTTELPTQPPPQRPDVVSFKNKNHRFSSNPGKDVRTSYLHSNNRQQDTRDVYDVSSETSGPSAAADITSVEDTSASSREGGVRTMVRVIKRPFLPSRGGNPYLPRGLKALGPSESGETTSAERNLGYSSSAEREVGYSSSAENDNYGFAPAHITDPEPFHPETTSTSTTTTETNPRAKLEEILSSDLDVTLNDALTPTLKPLVRSSPIGFSVKYNPGYYEPAIDRSDTHLKQVRAAATPFYQQQSPASAIGSNSGPAVGDFYSDYEY